MPKLTQPHRLAAFAAAGLSLLGLGVSSVGLAERIAEFHDDRGFARYYFIRTDREEFGFQGRLVTIDPVVNDDGDGTITVTYTPPTDAEDGSQPTEAPAESLVLPVAIPNEVPLPGLDRYMDWFQIFFFAQDPGGMPHEEWLAKVESGDIQTRCVIAARYPNPGVAEDSRFNIDIADTDWGYGETLRDRWAFQFHELMPDGSIRSSTLRWPESGKSFQYRKIAAEREGLPEPTRDPNEIKEGTWQRDAALRLSPRAPAITHENQALLRAGWTLPVASACVLGLMLSLAIGFAPDRRRA